MINRFVLAFAICCSLLTTTIASAQDYDTNRYYVHHLYRKLEKGYWEGTLNREEFAELQRLINKFVEKHNKRAEAYNRKHKEDTTTSSKRLIIDLDKYKQAYIITNHPNGDKVVLVRFFTSPYQWKKDAVVMLKGDGTVTFKVNLTKRKCFDLFSANDIP